MSYTELILTKSRRKRAPAALIGERARKGVKALGRTVASFDTFAYCCPYFTTEHDVNNGYGCNHPEQEETETDENGDERGECFCNSCPLGIEPDEKDFEDPDVEWDGITREDCTSSITGEISIDGDYIMINTGSDATLDERNAWDSYKQFINRYN